jgi:hypothetical protein
MEDILLRCGPKKNNKKTILQIKKVKESKASSWHETKRERNKIKL